MVVTCGEPAVVTSSGDLYGRQVVVTRFFKNVSKKVGIQFPQTVVSNKKVQPEFEDYVNVLLLHKHFWVFGSTTSFKAYYVLPICYILSKHFQK